jgi:8-oxo-dGTP diphosphatase
MTQPDSDFREPHLRENDFLGAFAVIQSDAGILMVQNRRRIGGASVLTWDLPGGQVEPGEELGAALRRELDEEVGIAVASRPEFLFVQEGVRTIGGERAYAWRSFFFRVTSWSGEPTAGAEVLASRWMRDEEMAEELTAPYHDSFLAWKNSGGTFFTSCWSD